jgi:hypothetical protein
MRGMLAGLFALAAGMFDDGVPPVPVAEKPVGFGESRGVVNARKLGLSKHAHHADPAKKRTRRLQRLARREQRSA